MMIALIHICALHYGSHQPYVANEQLKRGEDDWGTEFLTLFKFNWKLKSHM